MKPDERQQMEKRDRERRKEEPVGTKEPIPGYGQAPEGVRTLRLPDEAPKKKPDEQED